jgi:toxin ParE1/3/4
MRLVWSQFALSDRDAIYDYIDSENPLSAAAVDQRISASANRLLEFPESGRIGRINGTRELVILRTPFILAYSVTGDLIRILRVLHGAQLWPDEF